jgi:hypothetical protein
LEHALNTPAIWQEKCANSLGSIRQRSSEILLWADGRYFGQVTLGDQLLRTGFLTR